jgi:hypothetical protein
MIVSQKFYIKLHEVNGEVDSVSVDILKKFQPVVLEDVYPARVAADGNCLYRAISILF